MVCFAINHAIVTWQGPFFSLTSVGDNLQSGPIAILGMLSFASYFFIAHLIIVIATWFGARGWHGLFAATSLVFLFHLPVKPLLGFHNFLDALLERRFELLRQYDCILIRFMMGLAIALLLKPIFLAFRGKEPTAVRYDMADLMWLSMGAAMVGLGSQQLRFHSANRWNILQFAAVSCLACGLVFLKSSRHRIAIGLGLIGSISFVIAKSQLDPSLAKLLQRYIW